ncbi:MAG: DMT family transporter [Rhodobacteraceae bacterium]|nr:DMT family transporter [Paracoccaceae bacterium]
MNPIDWVLLFCLSMMWGGSFFFVEVAVPHLPPLSIVLARVALAAAALALVLKATGAALPRGRVVWSALAVMALFNCVVPFTLFAAAQGQIESGLAAILNATTPLFGVVVAHLFTADERMTPARVAGICLGIGGVAVMMGGAVLREPAATVTAQAACLLAALSYAGSGVWGRRFGRMGLHPLATATGQLTLASVMMLPLVLLFDRPWTLAAPPAHVWGALAGMALLSTALAYPLYFRLLGRVGASNILLVTLLIPVSAILLGVGILGEVLAAKHVAGMALIAAGLLAIDGRVLAPLSRLRPR